MILDRTAWASLAAGLVLFLAAAVAAAWLDNYQLQVGASLAMLCVLCLAWNLVGGIMGYPSFATITFFGVGAYAGAIAQVNGAPVGIGWLAAAAAGAVLATALGAALLRLKGHYFAIGTIATVEVFREMANNLDAVTGGAVGLNVPMMAGSPEVVGRFFFLALTGLAALAFLVTVLVVNSKFGFGLRCIRQNERAAAMVGIEVTRTKVAAFVLSGALCAAAGGMYASMVSFIEPKDAFNLIMTIEIPVMVMLGGMGTVFGPLIGSMLYVLLKEFVWANFIDWHSGILGVIIVLVVCFRPGGAFTVHRATIARLLDRVRSPSAKVST